MKRSCAEYARLLFILRLLTEAGDGPIGGMNEAESAYNEEMMIQPPDDELDERWRALHEHPELGKVPSFDALDLSVKSHANDVRLPGWQPEHKDKPRRHSNAIGADGQDTETESDEEIGHDMLVEEYENWMKRPSVIETDDYPL